MILIKPYTWPSGDPSSMHEIQFQHQLDVREGASVSIKSADRSRMTLSGQRFTRLFFLRNGSKMSLRDLDLVRGAVTTDPDGVDCYDCGGAIFVSPGSELLLVSVRVSANRASLGGAIYVQSSTVIASDCTFHSNSALDGGGGAVFAGSNSTITAIDCTMTLNSANRGRGGAVAAVHGSIVTAIDCTTTSNRARRGGTFSAEIESTITATNCSMVSNSAISGGGAVTARAAPCWQTWPTQRGRRTTAPRAPCGGGQGSRAPFTACHIQRSHGISPKHWDPLGSPPREPRNHPNGAKSAADVKQESTT